MKEASWEEIKYNTNRLIALHKYLKEIEYVHAPEHIRESHFDIIKSARKEYDDLIKWLSNNTIQLWWILDKITGVDKNPL